MEQLKVKDLYRMVREAMMNGAGDKYIVVADDTEGNGYHGMFFGLTYEPADVAECLDPDYIYDSHETDLNNLVILG